MESTRKLTSAYESFSLSINVKVGYNRIDLNKTHAIEKNWMVYLMMNETGQLAINPYKNFPYSDYALHSNQIDLIKIDNSRNRAFYFNLIIDTNFFRGLSTIIKPYSLVGIYLMSAFIPNTTFMTNRTTEILMGK